MVTLAIISLVAGAIAWRLLPGAYPRTQRLSLILGYASLAAILATLLLGPINVLGRRPNPVSSDLRRDIGLFAVATGIAHVVVSLVHHFGGDPVQYFFTTSRPALGSIRSDDFGISVWIGAVATVLLAGLGLISNDASLRKLGRQWKALQRGNYALVVLVLVHTWLFWKVLDRMQGTRFVVVVASVTMLVLQLLGVFVIIRRTSSERHPGPPATTGRGV